jgi:hypothetical protein
MSSLSHQSNEEYVLFKYVNDEIMEMNLKHD